MALVVQDRPPLLQPEEVERNMRLLPARPPRRRLPTDGRVPAAAASAPVDHPQLGAAPARRRDGDSTDGGPDEVVVTGRLIERGEVGLSILYCHHEGGIHRSVY